jgi:hypothetical protein
MVGVSASGATNAWAVGETIDFFPCGNPCMFATHWNGKKWQRVPVPALPVGDNLDWGSASVAAIAGGRAWVFVSQTNAELGTSAEVALEWTGTSWSAATPLPGSPGGPIAAGPDDVWGFENDNGTPMADHYNGIRWSKVPIAVNVSAASASHAAGAWVIGTVPGQPNSVEVLHWSKGAWRNEPLPAISVPKGDQLLPGFIAPAISPASVFATVSVSPVKGVGTGTTILLHWNGNAWSRVPVPKGVGIVGLSSDGYGGAWVASYKGNDSNTGVVIMYHYHGLHWTHVTVPVRPGFNLNVSGGLKLIPGTRSVLAPATLEGSPAFNAAVLKYGP